jgi:hypothetical protein
MKKVFFVIITTLLAYSAWAQNTKLKIVSFTINEKNITNEFNQVIIKWNNRNVVKKDSNGFNYNETVYELEIKLYNVNTKSAETIILTEGLYAGGTTIYFDNVIFPRNPEKKLKCEYWENVEDCFFMRLIFWAILLLF